MKSIKITNSMREAISEHFSCKKYEEDIEKEIIKIKCEIFEEAEREYGKIEVPKHLKDYVKWNNDPCISLKGTSKDNEGKARNWSTPWIQSRYGSSGMTKTKKEFDSYFFKEENWIDGSRGFTLEKEYPIKTCGNFELNFKENSTFSNSVKIMHDLILKRRELKTKISSSLFQYNTTKQLIDEVPEFADHIYENYIKTTEAAVPMAPNNTKVLKGLFK